MLFRALLFFIILILNSYIFANDISNKTKIDSMESSIESFKADSKDSKEDSLLKDYEISTWRYISVILIMVVILVLLYVIRLRQNKGQIISNITLEQAKILDSKNKIAIIKYNDKKYLIGLNPNGITLLDKNIDSIESSKLENIESNLQNTQDFETLLESKTTILDTKDNKK